MIKQIVLFTESYPFVGGEQFLETEIVYLAQRCKQIIVVPRSMEGINRPLPKGVSVDISLAKRLPRNHRKYTNIVARGIISPSVYKELFKHYFLLRHPLGIFRIFSYWNTAITVYKWLDQFFENHGISSLSETLFYTYWLGSISLGIGLLKSRYPNLRLVSRAHGGDLYEDRYKPPYLPFRLSTLKSLDLLALVSKHGQNYIERYWPSVNLTNEIHRLGVNDPGFDTKPSADGVFRIVSCSYVVALKRLPLLIRSLRVYADSYSKSIIEWHHIGHGPLFNEIKHLAENILPEIRWYFHGHLRNEDVMAFYRVTPVDVFVNVSQTEGVPVSIMEAQSCGIPVVATAVGGVPEIVNDQNGVLLEPNPSPTQIADALAVIAFNESIAATKRTLSKQMWESTYNASVNYNQFIDRIMQLLS